MLCSLYLSEKQVNGWVRSVTLACKIMNTSSVDMNKCSPFYYFLQGMERLEEIFNCEGKAVDDLLNIAKVSLSFEMHVYIQCFRKIL